MKISGNPASLASLLPLPHFGLLASSMRSIPAAPTPAREATYAFAALSAPPLPTARPNASKYRGLALQYQHKKGLEASAGGIFWNKQKKKFDTHLRFRGRLYYLGSYNVAADGALAYDKAVVALNLNALLKKNFPTFNDYETARQREIETRSDIKDLISLEEIIKQMDEMVAKKCSSPYIRVDELACVERAEYFDAFFSRQMGEFESTRPTTVDLEDVEVIDGLPIWSLPQADQAAEDDEHMHSQTETGLRHVLLSNAKRSNEDNASGCQTSRLKQPTVCRLVMF